MKKITSLLLTGLILFGNSSMAQSNSKTDTLQKEAARQLELATQKQEESTQLQSAAMQKQQQSEKEQKKQLAKQQTLMQEQEQQMQEQEHVKKVLLQTLVEDGYIKKGNPYEIELNNQELLINGNMQPDDVHQKYIELINGARKKPFGKSEQWHIREE